VAWFGWSVNIWPEIGLRPAGLNNDTAFDLQAELSCPTTPAGGWRGWCAGAVWARAGAASSPAANQCEEALNRQREGSSVLSLAGRPVAVACQVAASI